MAKSNEKQDKAKAKGKPSADAKGGKGKQASAKDKKKGKKAAPEEPSRPAVPPRMRDKYREKAIPGLTKKFGYTNPMQLPRVQKIVVNMGLGQAVANPKMIDAAVDELCDITGQKPVVARAKKAISNYKLRTGMPIGVFVTLRRERMWEFLDRLITVGLPRVRDFKGVSPKGFDGRGNYTLGLREQIIFPEINYDKIDATRGMNVSIVTSAKTDEEGRALLTELGMPFRS
jgi:large subunit ribosomal protein L5